jgi:ectoine hydroxylase-related dioxygenase (phytanoyl-CoA dioxygenase family)
MQAVNDQQRALTFDEADAYRETGYLVLRNVFGQSEMTLLAEEVEKLAARTHLIDKHNLRCRFQSHYSSDECLFETFDPVIDISDVCRSVAYDERILNRLADLYGERACLFKDKLIFKQPGTVGYRLHQDWIGWPDFPRSFLTVLVPIDAADEQNGCTEVIPGYHHKGCLTTEDGEYHELPSELVDESKIVKLLLDPGDIAIFSGFTPHRSGANTSSRWRRQLYLSYNALSDGGDQRDAHYVEFRRYLRRRYAEYDLTDTYFL